jgi:hypothetical protein
MGKQKRLDKPPPAQYQVEHGMAIGNNMHMHNTSSSAYAVRQKNCI